MISRGVGGCAFICDNCNLNRQSFPSYSKRWKSIHTPCEAQGSWSSHVGNIGSITVQCWDVASFSGTSCPFPPDHHIPITNTECCHSSSVEMNIQYGGSWGIDQKESTWILRIGLIDYDKECHNLKDLYILFCRREIELSSDSLIKTTPFHVSHEGILTP